MNDILAWAKLPRMDALKKTHELAEKKRALYIEYREIQRQMRELVAVKGNVDRLLCLIDGRVNKAKERNALNKHFSSKQGKCIDTCLACC